MVVDWNHGSAGLLVTTLRAVGAPPFSFSGREPKDPHAHLPYCSNGSAPLTPTAISWPALPKNFLQKLQCPNTDIERTACGKLSWSQPPTSDFGPTPDSQAEQEHSGHVHLKDAAIDVLPFYCPKLVVAYVYCVVAIPKRLSVLS